MPIVKVIGILIGDSGTHFDKNVVDKFLQTTLDKITEVFLTENHLVLSENDKKLLSQYTLLDLYNSINAGENTELVDKFNFYYTGTNINAAQV